MKRMSALIMCSCLLTFVVSSVFSGEVTDLSKKAATLTIGMPRQNVINLLGNPSWAVIPADKGDFHLSSTRVILGLYWKNTPCSPVVVDFDNAYKVIGWDEGRALCGDDAQLYEPSEEYSCSKKDRYELCK